jgi:hypothetical protein
MPIAKTTLDEILGWDTRNWSRALEACEPMLHREQGLSALEIGAPPDHGGLSLWMALNGYQVTCSGYGIYGPWINNIDKLKTIHNQHHVGAQINYEEINACNIPHNETFDLVILKSVLGGIVRQKDFSIAHQVTDQIYKYLRPGGIVIALENLISTPIHNFLRRRYTAGSQGWRYFTENELLTFYSKFSVKMFEKVGLLGCFGRNLTQQNILGLVDQYLLERITGNHWGYIGAMVAQKPQD